MRALAMENEGIIQEGGEADGSFDTLQELKELKSNQPEEPQNNENGAADLLKKVNEARRGNIYSAVVLAKGQDELALRIVSVAEENNVAVVENVSLARALYAGTELNREIPPEFYGPVAEILVYVLKLDQQPPAAN